MSRHDLLYLNDTSRSGDEREIVAQTHIAKNPNDRAVTVGTKLEYDLAHLAEHYLLVRNPERGEPIRVLEYAELNRARRVYLEATLSNDQIVCLREVELDFEELELIHFAPQDLSFSSWLDPADWADRLFSSDLVSRLRAQLMLRSVLPARNRHEANICVDMLELTALEELQRAPAGNVWRQQCRSPFDHAIEMRFALEDDREVEDFEVVALPAGPSRIVPPEEFRRRADELISNIPSYPSDLDPERRMPLKYYLGQATVYLNELLKMIPSDASEVPIERFWTDDGRDSRRARPDRYRVDELDRTIGRLRRVDPELEKQPVPIVRSAEEAELFIEVHPCPVCGSRTFDRTSRVDSDEIGLLSHYEGRCHGCATMRRFDVRLAEEMPPIHGSDTVNYGDGQSRALDPGQFAAAAERIVAEVHAEENRLQVPVRQRLAYRLRFAIGAIDEALKFIPGAESVVPAGAVTSIDGWRYYDADPARVTRSHLNALREGAATELSELTRS